MAKWVILSVGALALVLTACGGGQQARPKVTVTTVTATPTPSEDSTDLTVPMTKREEIYLKLVRQDITAVSAMSDENLIGLGHTICDAVKVDSPIEAALGLVKGLTDNGFGGREAGEMLAYASALCPEKQAALTIGQ